MNASIDTNKIAVIHTINPDLNREFLRIDVPNGWDDVKKIKNKVLTYDKRHFTFTGWNSDTNYCFFYRVINGTDSVATIKH